MRREYVGGAQAARLTAVLGGTTGDLAISCNDLTNWPTGTGGTPFYVVINRGTASEEKILCASRSGNTLAVYDVGLVNGRGADDTSITAHAVNSVIEHVFTATDADEANALVNLLTTAGDLITYGATGNERIPVGADGSILVASTSSSNGLVWQVVGSDNDILIADSTQPSGVRWGTPQSSFDIINPFLLMGA